MSLYFGLLQEICFQYHNTYLEKRNILNIRSCYSWFHLKKSYLCLCTVQTLMILLQFLSHEAMCILMETIISEQFKLVLYYIVKIDSHLIKRMEYAEHKIHLPGIIRYVLLILTLTVTSQLYKSKTFILCITWFVVSEIFFDVFKFPLRKSKNEFLYTFTNYVLLNG